MTCVIQKKSQEPAIEEGGSPTYTDSTDTYIQGKGGSMSK